MHVTSIDLLFSVLSSFKKHNALLKSFASESIRRYMNRFISVCATYNFMFVPSGSKNKFGSYILFTTTDLSKKQIVRETVL